MRIGDQICGADFNAVAENPAPYIVHFPCKNVTINGEVNDVIYVNIPCHFPGYPGEWLF